MNQKERNLLSGLGSIEQPTNDKPLPRTIEQEVVSTPSVDGRLVTESVSPKLTVEDVLSEDSPYRKINSDTGEEFIDTSDLHITDMDTDNVRKALKERRDKAKQVIKELEDLETLTEQKIKAKGDVEIKVDISRDVNLRQAIVRLFGKKTNVITFSMYKELVRLKERMNKDDANGALGGQMKHGDKLC